MKHTLISVVVGALGSTVLLCAAAIADPGSGHGLRGKGACVSGCENVRRDCNKKATSDRKTCYTQTCAPQRAAVEACHGGAQGCSVAAQALRLCLQNCKSTFNA